MNYKKFFALHERLMYLLAEQLDLFIFERPLMQNWLEKEHYQNKYPYFAETKLQNEISISLVLKELTSLLTPTLELQPEEIFK